MATSKCTSCDGNRFEGVNKRIIGIHYPITFIQCADCGCVIGVLNTEVLGQHIENGVQALADIISNQ